MNQIILGGKMFFSRVRSLIRHPVFGMLTILGNSVIIAASLAFYFIERDSNPELNFIDAVWWCMTTVTTVGYGDIVPVTLLGRALGIFVMILGTALFGSFIALFAAVMVSPEIQALEREIETDENKLQKIVYNIEAELNDFKKHLISKQKK